MQSALSHGYSAIGFADHGPWPFHNNFVSGIRMTCDQLPEYVRVIRALGAQYDGQIRVFCGLEYEYFPEFASWMRDMFEQQALDYLILGNHFDTNEDGGKYFGNSITKEQLRQYVDMTIAGMETGMYLYVAHPDLFLRFYPQFDDAARECSRELMRASKALNVPLEFNLLGVRYKSGTNPPSGLGYPCNAFWELAAQESCTAVIGVDAHKPMHLCDPELFDLAALYLDTLGLNRLASLNERIKPLAHAAQHITQPVVIR